MNDQFSNAGLGSTFIITSIFSGILFDWSAYGFSFALGLVALLSLILLTLRYLDGRLQ